MESIANSIIPILVIVLVLVSIRLGYVLYVISKYAINSLMKRSKSIVTVSDTERFKTKLTEFTKDMGGIINWKKEQDGSYTYTLLYSELDSESAYKYELTDFYVKVLRSNIPYFNFKPIVDGKMISEDIDKMLSEIESKNS